MKFRFSLTVLSVFISLLAFSQIQKEVLFIGNSYTGTNNLSLMIKNMTESAGDILIYESHSPGGTSFSDHLANPVVAQKINSNDWDYVVLQEQSQMPAFPTDYVNQNVYPMAQALCNMIRENNECSKPMFYMTWGRKNGDQSNCNYMPWMCTYEGMDDALRSSYLHMAETNLAELAPVGAVWRYIRENHPEINLYSSDESHPSIAGTYAAGCAFYTTIYKKNPNLITWNSSLSESVANTIKEAAEIIAFNSANTWDFSVNPATAAFTEEVYQHYVLFTNESAGSDSLIWIFGDGESSQQETIVHDYINAGTYTASLINFKCGQSDTLTKTIIISTSVNVENAGNENLIELFPNPAQNTIHLKMDSGNKAVSYTIKDMTGKLVTSKSAVILNSEINISALKSGMYLLNVFVNDEMYTLRFQKL